MSPAAVVMTAPPSARKPEAPARTCLWCCRPSPLGQLRSEKQASTAIALREGAVKGNRNRAPTAYRAVESIAHDGEIEKSMARSRAYFFRTLGMAFIAARHEGE